MKSIAHVLYRVCICYSGNYYIFYMHKRRDQELNVPDLAYGYAI